MTLFEKLQQMFLVLGTQLKFQWIILRKHPEIHIAKHLYLKFLIALHHETQKLSEKELLQLQIKEGVLHFVTITSIRCKIVQESKNQFRSVKGLLQTAENISWNTFLEVFCSAKKKQ